MASLARSGLAPLLSVMLVFSAGCPGEDTTPPSVEIITPARGDTVSGVVPVRVRATDNRGVVQVQFSLDGSLLGADSSPDQNVFSLNWNTTGLAPGSARIIGCAAQDRAGNRGVAEVEVIISPAAGTRHRGPITAPETWKAAGNPHVVEADLAVETRLVLEPGVVVLVADRAAIDAGSRYPAAVVCRGRSDSAVVITALSSTPGPGSWQGIRLLGNCQPDSSVFEYCTIEYGGGNGRGLIYSDGARPAFRNCILRHSAAAGVAATRLGFGAFAGNVASDCAGFPVSVDAGSVSTIGANNNLANNARRGIEVTGGTVATSTDWPNRFLPYCVTSTITVAGAANPLLTVAPGCSLLFADSVRLRVGAGAAGGLAADGSYGPILFGPLSSAPAPGAWRGIEFWEGTDAGRTVLRFCRVEYAGFAGSAAVSCYSAPVTMTGCRISAGAGDGLQCTDCGFSRLEHDTVVNCAGYPLRIGAAFVGSLGTGNSFTGNGRDSILVSSGTITRSAQWRRHSVPYLVRGSVEVGSAYEPTLTIDPGVQLCFVDSGLVVGRRSGATLTAVGLPDSIVFTGSDAVPGAWRGVELHPYADSRSRLIRCRLLYGGVGGRGILYVDSCVPGIRENEVAYSSSYCAYLWNTDLEADSLLAANWLHDPAPGYDTVFEGGRKTTVRRAGLRRLPAGRSR
ncbi:right-handed parallel beta-helix repeat-containing protein [candidate division WOR-3 bacterium]|nr:right-handed parallel beta-helix repeat-containing protein [candidate division WOR-3 bacterium]